MIVLAAKVYLMAYGLDIKKQYWKRYQIIRKISYQHQYYGMGVTSKHEIGEYKIGKYGYLSNLRKSCQYYNINSQQILEI